MLLFRIVVVLFALECYYEVFGQKFTNIPQPEAVLPKSPEDYLAGRLVVKVAGRFKPYARTNHIALPVFEELWQKNGITGIEKQFPTLKPLPKKVFKSTASVNDTITDLSLTYILHLQDHARLGEVMINLRKSGLFDYVEPIYIDKVHYTPNDSFIVNNMTDWFGRMQAAAAWDISKGDTNTVIAVVDNGFQVGHPDLVNQCKYNYADPINGIDDDRDGYIDNFRGWDFVGANFQSPRGDNNPDFNGGGVHGIEIAGLCSMQPDNRIGGAGVGFNCKYLPLKAGGDNTLSITQGYQAMVYAAERGAKVINCSWGGVFWSNNNQSIVDYVAVLYDVVIVASAGNNDGDGNPDNDQDLFYPASYNNVLSVAASNHLNQKSALSSYNYRVDVNAPAAFAMTPTWQSAYKSTQRFGYTSHAAPLVSGLAALVRSHFPFYNFQQTIERLRLTADPIDTNNTRYGQLIGTGRINMLRALKDTLPAIRITAGRFIGRGDVLPERGDTFNIEITIKNHLDDSRGAVTVTLSCADTAVRVVQGQFNAGPLNANQTATNNNAQFVIRISDNAPVNRTVNLKFTYRDSLGYLSFEYIPFLINPGYYTIDTNLIRLTFNSMGNFGFNNYPRNTQGVGMSYRGSNNLLYEGGLLIGSSAAQLSDNIRNNFGVKNSNYEILEGLKLTKGGQIADVEGKAIFRQKAADKLTVEQNLYAWGGQRRYILSTYKLRNSDTVTKRNIFLGTFADFDVINSSTNVAGFDSVGRFAFTRDRDRRLFAGMGMLHRRRIFTHATQPTAASLTPEAKFNAISGVGSVVNLGPTEVVQYLSTGGMTLQPGDTTQVAVVLMAGDSLPQLRQAMTEAEQFYRCKVLAHEPHLNFVASSYQLLEQSKTGRMDCKGYTDYRIPIVLSAPIRTPTTVSFNITQSNAIQDVDYNLLTPNLVLNAGARDTQFILLRVFQDRLLDGNKSFILHYSIPDTTELLTGCDLTSTTVTLLDNPNEPPITITGTTSLCTNTVGTLRVPLFQNTTYQWLRNHIPLNQQTNANLVITAGGEYRVILIDASGCEDTTDVFSVLSVNPAAITLNKRDVSRFGQLDGSITVMVSGGVPPFRYAIDTNRYVSTNTFTGLSAGTYQVYVKDGFDCMIFGTITLTEPSALLCFEPANLRETNLTATSVLLRWEADPQALRFEVRYRPSQAANWTVITSATNQIQLNGLNPNTLYEYQIRTRCHEGRRSGFTISRAFRTTLAVNCTPPTNFRVTGITATSITLAWSNVPQAIRYEIWFRPSTARIWSIATVSGNEHTLQSLFSNTTYITIIRAVCGSNIFSDFSPQVSRNTASSSVTPNCFLVPTPSVSVSGITARITWPAIVGVDRYLISFRRNVDNGAWTNTTVSDTVYTMSFLQPGMNYLVRVRTNCTGINSSFSAEVAFAAPSTRSLEKANDDLPSFSLYPNPAQEHVMFRFENPRNDLLKLQIYDISGKQIFEYHPALHETYYQLNVLNWPAGIYAIKVYVNNIPLKSEKLVLTK